MKHVAQRAILLLILMVSLAGMPGCNSGGMPVSTLSPERISELRQAHPTVPWFGPTVQGKHRGMSDTVNWCMAYVVAEVLPQDEELMQLGHELDFLERSKTNPLAIPPNIIRLKGIQIRIAEIIFENESVPALPEPMEVPDEARLHEGQELTVTINTTSDESVPHLEPGMVLVVPVFVSVEESPEYSLDRFGMYYIVDDAYILSALAELEDEQYSGWTLDGFKNELLRLKSD